MAVGDAAFAWPGFDGVVSGTVLPAAVRSITRNAAYLDMADDRGAVAARLSRETSVG